MGKWQKLMGEVLRGSSDANISYADLSGLLLKLGFEKRTRGSHAVFRKAGITEKLNLQRDGVNAKPYQVRQVREIIFKYHLGDLI